MNSSDPLVGAPYRGYFHRLGQYSGCWNGFVSAKSDDGLYTVRWSDGSEEIRDADTVCRLVAKFETYSTYRTGIDVDVDGAKEQENNQSQRKKTLTNRLGFGKVEAREGVEIEIPKKEKKKAEKVAEEDSSDLVMQQPSSTPARFAVGEAVLARGGDGSAYWPGVIAKVNSDGSYIVDYDDGDSSKIVKERRIKNKPEEEEKEEEEQQQQEEGVAEEDSSDRNVRGYFTDAWHNGMLLWMDGELFVVK
ncbi:hypothetical protein TL16_g00822 [Triparma laevis f. inornata]|uniref:Tudor domain-containing protein n=2 Tax=Triparma laevis TaxID=1534972 RepID=A0A9W7FBT6_9STRA|nr:hypothetical protein TL16_g00822 [Triparma laevis f. inornata]GMI09269.1 hypothetical protein TrLO_g2045 [Triparma laevis f. longispina]